MNIYILILETHDENIIQIIVNINWTNTSKSLLNLKCIMNKWAAKKNNFMILDLWKTYEK